jgi:hypothetical protein
VEAWEIWLGSHRAGGRQIGPVARIPHPDPDHNRVHECGNRQDRQKPNHSTEDPNPSDQEDHSPGYEYSGNHGL